MSYKKLHDNNKNIILQRWFLVLNAFDWFQELFLFKSAAHSHRVPTLYKVKNLKNQRTKIIETPQPINTCVNMNNWTLVLSWLVPMLLPSRNWYWHCWNCIPTLKLLLIASTTHAPTVVRQTQHSYAAGLAVTKVRQVIASNNYVVAGQMTNPQPVTSHVAEHPHNPSETEAPPAPVIPAPCAVPARPAPAGTGVQTEIADPFSTHTRNNPQVTNVVTKLKTI